MTQHLRGIMPLAILAGSLASPSAHAWEHLGHVWLPEDMPLEYYVAGEDACALTTVPPEYCTPAMQEAWSIWENTPCIELSTQYAGECENVGYDPGNGLLYITFDDPEDELEAGAIAAALSVDDRTLAFVLEGTAYLHAYDSDIVFNDNTLLDTRENIQEGRCNGGFDMVMIGVHEMGHTLGLGHSCEENEVCTDPLLKNAIMYWTGAPCLELDPVEDDIEGLTALYGPYASFVCSHTVSDDLAIGIVPFELKCVITSDDVTEITKASWRFGDGGVSDQVAASHTYTEPGNYTVQVTVNGDREECGADGWEYNYRRVGYVRACGLPEPEFTYEPIEGLTYQLMNESNVSVYGCIQDIQWEVYKGSKVSGNPITELTAKAWEPQITFPEAGEYTVVMNLGGPAGTTASALTIEVKKSAGTGCETVGASDFGVAGALAGLLVLARRRRD
ncbi:MAG: hypothetical protein ACI8PZ_000341 [Myxococcota bacterium]|jgi:hypothetical protein